MENNKEHTADQLPLWLNHHKKKGDGLQTPEAEYFQRLADAILQEKLKEKPFVARLPDAPMAAPTKGRSRVMPSWWWAVAASVLLLLWWSASDRLVQPPASTVASSNSQDAWQNQLDQLSEEDLTNYIQENIQEFELETLLAIND